MPKRKKCPPRRKVRRVVRKGKKPGPKTVTVKRHKRSKPC